MGSKDDDYFIRKYAEGENVAFFAINSPDDSPWIDAFCRIVSEVGLKPVTYSGAGRDIVPPAGQSNTIDDELRDDFYPAKTKVLYFGEPRTRADDEDHWALSNLAHVSPEHTLLVFISKDFPLEILRRSGFEGAAEIVAGPAEFEKSLREHLVV